MARTKINKSFSSWAELIQGVLQGSVLGPLLFNIDFNDLFYPAESTEVCNFADGTTFFACGKDLKTLISRLDRDIYLAIEWFESNSMKLNQDKCHLLVSGYKHRGGSVVLLALNQTQLYQSLSIGSCVNRFNKIDKINIQIC